MRIGKLCGKDSVGDIQTTKAIMVSSYHALLLDTTGMMITLCPGSISISRMSQQRHCSFNHKGMKGMADKHLHLRPHNVTKQFWWYEDRKGLTICSEINGHSFIVGDIPWRSIRAALKRKDRKEDEA